MIKRGRQFSIRVLLGLACVAALGVAYWKAVIWEPPTDQFSLYEKAQAFHGSTATIGPNQIRIVSIARNDRDGTVVVTTPGAGETADVAIDNRQALVDCAPWLDVVQIELQPGGDLLDIVELRVFDHQTRQALSVDHPLCGYRVARPNVLHLYGLGEALPSHVDVWMRVHSRQSAEVAILAKNIGARATVQNCEFTIAQLQDGFSGWSLEEGLFPAQREFFNNTGVLFELQPDQPPKKLYQFAAVTELNRKQLSPTLNLGEGKGLVEFQIPLEEIQYFEIRPWGTRARFFFDGVELPKLKPSKQGFLDPPIATVRVDGQEAKQSLLEFAPLDMELIIRDGQPYSGTASGSNFFQLTLREDGPINEGKEFTLVLLTRGIVGLPYQVRFRRTGANAWMNDRGMMPRGRHTHTNAFTGNQEIFERNYQNPLSELEAIEISF